MTPTATPYTPSSATSLLASAARGRADGGTYGYADAFGDAFGDDFGDNDRARARDRAHTTPTLAIDFGAASKHDDDGGADARRPGDGGADPLAAQAYVVGVLTGFLDNLTRWVLRIFFCPFVVVKLNYRHLIKNKTAATTPANR